MNLIFTEWNHHTAHNHTYDQDLLHTTHSQSSICNFADDTTPQVSGYVLNDVLNLLEQESTILIKWFRDNFMTLN